jgi:acetylornithine deacetylase
MGRIGEIIRDTARLVAVSSESGKERQIAQLVYGDLRAMGYKPEMVDGDDNVALLIPGRNRDRLFIANGHLDTVPLQGREPKLDRRGKWLIGPGAGDMKAGDAIIMDLARDRELPCDVFISLVPQEETGGKGSERHARYLRETHLERYDPDNVGGIIFEPTFEGDDDTSFVGEGHRGGVKVAVMAVGEGGHGGKDYTGRELAIPKLGAVLAATPDLQKEWARYADKYGVPTINATLVNAGSADNVVDPNAGAILDIRSTPTFAEVWPKIHDDLELEFDVTLTPRDSEEMQVRFCDPNSRIYQTVQRLMPGAIKVFGLGFTDLQAFKEVGVPVMMYGPGDMPTAHTPGDRVSIPAIVECRQNSRRILTAFATS